VHGIRRYVAADSFFTSCELANFLLTENIVVGTLRKNTPEIPALFLIGKQRDVHSFIFCFTSDLTLVSYVPARNKTVILLSSHMMTHAWERRITNLKSSCSIMPLKVGLTFWTSL
jgi:hypothetical protein